MTTTDRAVLIVGSGAAGHSCARTLRAQGFPGDIRLVDAEGRATINRTLVTKALLPGLLTEAQITMPPLVDVEAITGRARRLDAVGRSVTLDDGRELHGDAIVLACGSEPAPLDSGVAVDPAVRAHFVHSALDAARLREAVPIVDRARIVVLGAGFIGGEVASHYASAGARVTLIGRSSLPLRAAMGDDIAARLAALHAERVDARWGIGVRAVRSLGTSPRSDAVELELDDGAVLRADALVVAVGSTPAAEWAGFDGAIEVDGRFRIPTSPGLYAAGSVAAPALHGRALRVDHWDAAASQGAHAAKTVLHDFGLGEDPGQWEATTGYSLAVHGATVAACGVRSPDSRDETAEIEGGGSLTRFTSRSHRLTGVAGWNAGAHVAREGASLSQAV